MVTRFASRLAVPVLAVVMGLGVVGCDPGSDDDPAGDRTTASSPATAGSSPAGPGSAAGSSVAPNDSAIVDGLRAQGYECDDEVRCQRAKKDVKEVIELGAGRVVFVVTATGGKPDLAAALSSVLDDYGSVLPHRTFAGAEWEQFTSWAGEHGGDDRAEETIAGWQARIESGGPKVRKLILTLP